MSALDSGADQSPWYSQDAFWQFFEHMLFNPERMAQTPVEVDKIERLLGLAGKADILDLCCGTGRHSLELARRGHRVTGVDRTASYIERARREAALHNLHVAFDVADMQSYRALEQFDVALNLFGSFGYLETQDGDRTVVQNIFDLLRPGGQLLIETMGKEILARDFPARDWQEEGDLLLLSEKWVSHNWGQVETRWIAIRGAERIEYRTSIRSYSGVELASLLAECGFTDVRVFGSLDGAAYDQFARRLVVTGRK